MTNNHREICSQLGWSVHADETGAVTLEKCSPTGETIILSIKSKNFVDSIKSYAENFDVHDYFFPRLVCCGMECMPNSIGELLNRADAVSKMLKELAAALTAAEHGEGACDPAATN